jgi:hypothetical protein
MTRFDIALGKHKLKTVNQSVLDRITKRPNDHDFTLQEKAALCLVIAEKIFPDAEEDTPVDIAADLMYMPDFVISRIAQRILKV